MKKLVLVIISIISLSSFAQDKGYFGGFQFKSMIQNDYFNGGPNVNKDADSLEFTTSGKFGYTFGMTVRKKFSKTLALESGLRFVQRNFNVKIDSTVNGYESNLDYRLVSYEVPIKGIVSLRASKNSFFSVAFGVQLDLYPSNVEAINEDWRIQTHRKSWAHGSLVANAGWEIDVKDVGILYAGFSYTSPFGSPFTAKFGKPIGSQALTTSELTGNYFAIDLRYYFNEKSKKKKNH